jgi:hypothetical protein
MLIQYLKFHASTKFSVHYFDLKSEVKFTLLYIKFAIVSGFKEWGLKAITSCPTLNILSTRTDEPGIHKISLATGDKYGY